MANNPMTTVSASHDDSDGAKSFSPPVRVPKEAIIAYRSNNRSLCGDTAGVEVRAGASHCRRPRYSRRARRSPSRLGRRPFRQRPPSQPPLLVDLLAARLARSREQAVGRLERRLGGHHHVDPVRSVEHDPAGLGLDLGRLVIYFLVHNGSKRASPPRGSPGPQGTECVASPPAHNYARKAQPKFGVAKFGVRHRFNPD